MSAPVGVVVFRRRKEGNCHPSIFSLSENFLLVKNYFKKFKI